MSNTHWKRIGSNIDDFRTREEKEKDQRKAFKDWMKINRMKVMKPKFKNMPKRADSNDSSNDE